MAKGNFVLGIDTSNYKTSVALIDKNDSIICDYRTLLKVKQGERGLRQSDALFQHIENLPVLIEKTCAHIHDQQIGAIAFSQKPRPIEGSYMPVFRGGESMARSLGAALDVPIFSFSHQEGHIEVIKHYSDLKNEIEFLCYHLSGGTCELLKVNDDIIEIIGGSKDISFGQVIDRVGVAMGLAFPAGEALDQMALEGVPGEEQLKKIKLDGLYFNLSGIETQCSRNIQNHRNRSQEPLIKELFDKIGDLLIRLTREACQLKKVKNIMFTGGVSSSAYISRKIKNHFEGKDINIEFGQQQFSQDNAVGIALLGRKKLWP